MQNEKQIAAELVKARLEILLAKPFFAGLADLKITMPTVNVVEMDRDSTLATQTGDQILININAMQGMSNEEIDQIVEHELNHNLAGKAMIRHQEYHTVSVAVINQILDPK